MTEPQNKVTVPISSAATGDGQSPTKYLSDIIPDESPKSNENFVMAADKEHPR